MGGLHAGLQAVKGQRLKERAARPEKQKATEDRGFRFELHARLTVK
jgi:hypothetical protein